MASTSSHRLVMEGLRSGYVVLPGDQRLLGSLCVMPVL